MTESEREKVKLRANALDRAGIACVTVGVLAPFGTSFLNPNVFSSSLTLFFVSLLYLCAAVVLHHSALWTLEGLDR